MAIAVNWGELLKTAGPAIASYAGAKTVNRGVENVQAGQQARDAEAAAVNRAQAEIQARNAAVNEAREGRDAEMQAFKNAQYAALMKNMQDVKFADVSGFRSRVPELHFSGGSRPSAFGAEGKALAEVMGNRAMQQLMVPPGGGGGGGGGQAVPRGGGSSVMPDYQPAEQKGAGFWENALGIAGLGATAAGALMTPAKAAAGAGGPSYAAQVARNPQASFGGGSFVPAAAGIAGAAGSAAPRFAGLTAAQLFPSSTLAPALTSSLPGAVSFTGAAPNTALKGVSFMPGATAPAATTAAKGSSGLAKLFGATSGGASGALGAANMIAGPAGMAAGIIAPYLPAGKPREIADWASKGAMVGSFFPGAGTAIGAGIGAGIGAVKGHQNQTVGSRKDLAKQLGYGNLDMLYRALEGMGPEGQRLRHAGLNVIGKHDTKGNELWKQQVAALLGRR